MVCGYNSLLCGTLNIVNFSLMHTFQAHTASTTQQSYGHGNLVNYMSPRTSDRCGTCNNPYASCCCGKR